MSESFGRAIAGGQSAGVPWGLQSDEFLELIVDNLKGRAFRFRHKLPPGRSAPHPEAFLTKIAQSTTECRQSAE
jgi:hypothetical protein